MKDGGFASLCIPDALGRKDRSPAGGVCFICFFFCVSWGSTPAYNKPQDGGKTRGKASFFSVSLKIKKVWHF